MRFRFLTLAAALATATVLAGAAYAQDWINYVDKDVRLAVNLPTQPTAEDITFESEYGAMLPARRFTAARGDSRYVVTVIDYTDSNTPITDWRGSMQWALWPFRQMGKLTFDGYQEIDRIPGHQIAVQLPNGRRLYVGTNMYDKRLYVLEAELPGNLPPPEHFRASLQVLNETGNPIRLDDDGNPAQQRPIEQR
jgi:hypothetical protein